MLTMQAGPGVVWTAVGAPYRVVLWVLSSSVGMERCEVARFWMCFKVKPVGFADGWDVGGESSQG